MSADTHYSNAAAGKIPKRFLCGKKCKDGGTWTRHQWIVDCSRCIEKLKAKQSAPSDISRTDK